MKLRVYKAEDLENVRQLFCQTVTEVNSRDYSPAQISAWLGNLKDNISSWQKSLLNHQTILAWSGSELLGFADMTSDGYLDRLFVSFKHQREGIATELLNALEQSVSVNSYSANVSITARPFFEARGFKVVRKNFVLRDGVELINFTMKK